MLTKRPHRSGAAGGSNPTYPRTKFSTARSPLVHTANYTIYPQKQEKIPPFYLPAASSYSPWPQHPSSEVQLFPSSCDGAQVFSLATAIGCDAASCGRYNHVYTVVSEKGRDKKKDEAKDRGTASTTGSFEGASAIAAKCLCSGTESGIKENKRTHDTCTKSSRAVYEGGL